MITNTQGVEFVLCPKVATGRMANAAACTSHDDTETGGSGHTLRRNMATKEYAAMIAAAPAFGEPSQELVERVAEAIYNKMFHSEFDERMKELRAKGEEGLRDRFIQYARAAIRAVLSEG